MIKVLEKPCSPVGEVLFGLFEEGDAVVRDEVGEVVLVVVVSMLDLLTVKVECVVVEARVSNQPDPLAPPGGHVGPLVLVQVLTKVTYGERVMTFEMLLLTGQKVGEVGIIYETPQRQYMGCNYPLGHYTDQGPWGHGQYNSLRGARGVLWPEYCL